MNTMTDFKDRRSIRKYKRQELPSGLIDRLVKEASRAATMGGMQLYSVVVTESAAGKEKLAKAHHDQPMVTQAAAVLTFCADFNRFSRWCLQRDADPGYGNFISFVNAATDTLLFAQAFCTLAEENGLGTCILGTTVFNPEMIIRILELPPLVVPVLTVAAGYPDEWPEQTDRLPEEGIIHREKYTCFSTGQIDMIYAQKEALPESRHFVQINGAENLAQVFTRYRFTRKDNEEMSRKMLEVLKDQGFLGDLTQHDKVQ